MIQVLTSADYRQMPWKNGLGTTIELARDSGQDLQHFFWRISMADVSNDGAFSIFPAKQRLLSILDGQGLSLDLQDSRKQQIVSGNDVFSFSGDEKIDSKLIAGPIRDFNLIYNPAHFSAHMRMFRDESIEINSCADIVFIYNHRQKISIEINQQCYVLNAGASLKIEENNSMKHIKILENPLFYGVIVELNFK